MPAAIPIVAGAAAASAAAPLAAMATAAITGGAAASAAVGFAGALAGSVVTGAAALGASVLAGKLFAPKSAASATAPSSASITGSLQTLRSSVSPRQIVYGSTRKSGTLVFAAITGEENEYLHLVTVLASHPVEEFGGIYANGRPLADFGDGSQYRATLYDGTQTAADPDLVAEVDQWTGDHIGNGVAYLYVRLQYDPDVWQSGIPSFSVDILRGKYDIYDPRNGSTGWSDNAALCASDYLISELGFGVPLERINLDKIKAAATICDEQVAALGATERSESSDDERTLDDGRERSTTGYAETTQARYRCNGIIDSTAQPIDALDTLVDAMAGVATYNEGQFELYAGATGQPVAELTSSDLRGPVSVSGAIPRKSTVDAVGGVFRSPDNGWQATNFPQVGGGNIVQTLDLPLTIDASEAQRIAWIGLQQAGEKITLNFPATLDAIWLFPWEVLEVTLPQFGWTKKHFRILEKTVTGFGVDLSLREETASYEMPISEYQAMQQPPTIIPPAAPTPGQVQNLNGYMFAGSIPVLTTTDTTIFGDDTITATSTSESTSSSLSAALEWDALASSARVEYQLSMSDNYGAWVDMATKYGINAVVSNLQFGVVTRFRVRARYVASGAVGEWSEILSLTYEEEV